MQTFSFPGNCTRNQIEEFPRTRINISVRRCSPHPTSRLLSHDDTVRARARARATSKIHCPSTGVYRRNPQLTRIEISTLSPFLYNSIPGEVLEGATAPVLVQARSLHDEYTLRAGKHSRQGTSNRRREDSVYRMGNPLRVFVHLVCVYTYIRARAYVCLR